MGNKRLFTTSRNKLWSNFIIVIKLIIFKVLFAFAAPFNLNINQIDIKIAFLYGFID